MNKLIGTGLLAAAMAAPLAASADPVSWVDWNVNQGTVTQNDNTIGVSFTGTAMGVTKGDYFSAYPTAYLSDAVSNGPAGNGLLMFAGGANSGVQHIHFSSAVVDPYLAIVSLGASGAPASFVFQNVQNIELVSEGRGAYGDGALAVANGVVSGQEGHGVVRLKGTFTDLYFTTPTYENWYGATIGLPVTAVPEPSTWAMLGVGGLLCGIVSRRRRNDKFA